MSFHEKFICRVCGVNLTSENWYPSSKKNYNYICKKCMAIQSREHRRRYYIKTTRTSDGIVQYIRIKKRPYPTDEKCELCNRPVDGNKLKWLVWHHWNDEHPEWGIWICITCHIFVEKVERDFTEKYKYLKEQIEDGDKTHE